MRTLVPLLVSVGVLACSGNGGGDPQELPGRDPRLEAEPPSGLEALFERAGSPDAGYLAFDEVLRTADGSDARRSHRWDRESGRVRVEAVLEGTFVLALLDAAQPGGGRIWRDGRSIEGDSARLWSERAYALHREAIDALAQTAAVPGDSTTRFANVEILEAVPPGAFDPPGALNR